MDSMPHPLLLLMLLCFCLSMTAGLLLVATKRWHGRYSLDSTPGVQRMHREPTPRVGSLSLVVGVLAAVALAPDSVSALLVAMLLAGLPALLFGLAEDITQDVGVTARLLATMASGGLAMLVTGARITEVGLPVVDHALSFVVVSALFTAIAVGGVANAVNIVDGFNGLSSGMSVLAFLAYGAMAYSCGDATLAWVCLILAACMAGFFFVNWPLGKLFLGDGGAYFGGFTLAWVAVLLMARHPHVSAFAVLLVCGHPVMEVLFSIYRRRLKRVSPGQPDRQHLHSLVMRRYARRWLPQGLQNAGTGLMLALFSVPAMVLAVWTHQHHLASALAVLAFSLLYVLVYGRIVRHCWIKRTAPLLSSTTPPSDERESNTPLPV